MADQGNGTEASPESRLYAHGFSRRLEFWCPPGSEQAMTLDQAIAALDAGEVKPAPLPSWPGVHPDALVGFRPQGEEEIERLFRPPHPSDPRPLPSSAEPWAELVAEKLKPAIRKEIRAAVKAEARKRAQGPK